MNQLLFCLLVLLLQTAVVTASAQGATSGPAANVPRPKNGIAEYQQLAADAIKVVKATLDSVNRLAARTNGVPSKVSRAFIRSVERLQVESLRVRERAQAVQVRGDAYFENWQANLAQMDDLSVRQCAEKNRAELQHSFAKIKRASQETREIFQPFLTNLRKLRTALENDPNTTATQNTRDLIQSISQEGRQVAQGLAGIRSELKSMTELLTPAKEGSKPQNL
jgi:hypothetical protein